MEINKNTDRKELYGDLILSTKNWELFLAPSQTYLGTSVLRLKRDCEGLRSINTEEWCELKSVIKLIELNYMKTFDLTLFNWACADNASFREDSVENHSIHWHIHPRYKNPIVFNGLKFEDKEFGYPPQPKKTDLSDKFRKSIIVLIRKNF
ncbi:MAG: HIT family protein [Methanobacteriaceae archaeon]|jgi:diadenosine tetraphosphate (Ap4A) HIT family hydrolase|nr:HIT family protein [Methanobacteriaceae archaeon]